MRKNTGETMNLDQIWMDEKKLIPAVIQDKNTKDILMLGYMNKESFCKTLESYKVTFFSRSRQKLWTKGETSGNYLIYYSHEFDCDEDTILVQATNEGPTCHLETYSCFGPQPFSLQKLEKIIKSRVDLPESNSYTNELSIKGNKEIAKKIAEEANELAISSVTNDGRILDEAADLLFHVQVLLVTNDYSLADVEDVLEKRNKSQ